jgi:hypothetical protein
MFRAGLDVHCRRSWRGKAPRRHLNDSQNMRPRWQQSAIVATEYDISHRPAVDLKIEPEIPSKVRRSIDREAAKWMIRPEVTSTSLHKGANEHCASENQHQKNILNEAVFWFHNDNVTIELGFGQQVAAEPLKNLLKLSFCSRSRNRSLVPRSSIVTKRKL